jgi:hypothetical protein
MHINEHVSYPISKQDFMASCGNLSHVPADTRKWVEQTLPDRTYQSADDVIHALNLPHEH